MNSMIRETAPALYRPDAEHDNQAAVNQRKHAVLRACALAALVVSPLLTACGGEQSTDIPTAQTTSTVPPAPVYENAAQLDHMNFSTNPTIIQYKDPLASPFPGKKIDPKGVTLHWWEFSTGGDIEKFVKLMKQNKSCGEQGCSVQYVVTEEGKIYRMMSSPTAFAYHARGANNTTFGEEIEGDAASFAVSGPNFNKKKFEAVVSLTRELVDDFDLPIEGEAVCQNVQGIHGHSEYNNCGTPVGTKNDVGSAYSEAVINAVKSMDNHQ